MEEDRSYDLMYKIVLTGDSNVGKTSMLAKYLDNTFQNNPYPTIGVDLRYKDIVIDDKKIRLNLWDTAGQEKFRNVTKNYYNGSNGIILVCDITQKSSYDILDSLLNDIKNTIPLEAVEIILIANKIDLEDEREISFEILKEFGEKNNIEVFEASVKKGEGIKEAFDFLVKKIMNNKNIKNTEYNNKEEEKSLDHSYKLLRRKHTKKSKKKNCC